MTAYELVIAKYLDIHQVRQPNIWRVLVRQHRQNSSQYLQQVTSDHQMKVAQIVDVVR